MAATVRREAGFTLIELLVVVVILGIMAAVAIPRVVGAIDRAREAKAQADLRVIVSALERYFFDFGRYPARLGLLRGQYLKSDFSFQNHYGKVYFYAVNAAGAGHPHNLQEYVLGDPGPLPTPIGEMAGQWDATAVPLPEGRPVDTEAYYWGVDLGVWPIGDAHLYHIGPTKPTRPDLQRD